MSKIADILREEAEQYEAQLSTLPANYRPKGYEKYLLERAAAERKAEQDNSRRSPVTGY